MNTSNTLIQETQKLHRQLALIADAVVGHFETYGGDKGDVYTIAIYEQMTENTKMAGSLVDRLSSLDTPEAAQSKVMKKQPQTEQAAMNTNQMAVSELLDLEDKIGDVIGIVNAYASLGLENSKPTVTGNEVSVLMGLILDQLHSIQTGINQFRENGLTA